MKTLLATGLLALTASHAFAQTPSKAALATPTGNDVSVGAASYNYSEPGDTAISIHGPKFVVDYTGTRSLDRRRHWFAQAQARAVLGSTTYDGWCSPFIITPDASSPNGYALDLGDASPCSESGDPDWYVEGRGLAGVDVIGEKWAWSPYGGVGVRHLSNGVTGAAGYRTDEYLYLPLGVTTRTTVGSHGAPLSLNLEFDVLLHGWQNTHQSALGGGDVSATSTAPAFTVEGFTDVSFSQSGGWALRASAKYPLSRHVSLEPYYVRWSVNASAANYVTATFTVNNVTAREEMGFYEPYNVTNEFGVKLGFHF